MMYAKVTITTHCNARCKTCLMRLVKDRKHMSFSNFCVIAEKLKQMGLSCLHMYNVGESYLNPQHKEIFEKGGKLVGDKKVKIEMVKYLPTATKETVKDPNGKTMLELKISTGNQGKLYYFSFQLVPSRVSRRRIPLLSSSSLISSPRAKSFSARACKRC